MTRPIITLTTDFGPSPFPGLMKGVILGICPEAQLVDLSHAVAAQDVRQGALVIEQALEVFPFGTVHLGVVDPGVGTSRRPIAVAALGMFFVGPDNGLFTPALLADPQAKVFELTDESLFRQPVCATFHGRDVFAPVAAHLAKGLDPSKLGPLVRDPVTLTWPQPKMENGVLLGSVLSSDSFGNLDTNLPRALVEEFLAGRRAEVSLGAMKIRGIQHAYGQTSNGQPLALFNSMDRLELAINQGNLYARLAPERGSAFGLAVEVRPID
jgi:S-adenosylmethionine hydrolase